MIKRIIVCSSGYPTATDAVCPFVEQLVNAFSLCGISVTVVAPQSIVKHWFRGQELHPQKRTYVYNNGTPITIYQPYVMSFGNRFEKLNAWLRDRVVYQTLKKYNIMADVCYGHFWHHAYSLYNYARENKIPLIAVSGESVISLHRIHKPESLTDFIDYVSGLICVSSKNRDESVQKGLLADLSKCHVIPNAIDNNLFKVLDRNLLRSSYGIADTDFVIAYVGWFDHNKGVLRLSDAIDKLNNPNIKSIFIGDSRDNIVMNPSCNGILHKGRLPHDEIPKYLNMADVFVLPTLHEGCNNAIIEAMACGLPIISSDLPFNADVMDESNSIKVDPLNVDQIANAIKTLYDNPDYRNCLSSGALKTAESLTITERAYKIINFIESKIYKSK